MGEVVEVVGPYLGALAFLDQLWRLINVIYGLFYLLQYCDSLIGLFVSVRLSSVYFHQSRDTFSVRIPFPYAGRYLTHPSSSLGAIYHAYLLAYSVGTIYVLRF